MRVSLGIVVGAVIVLTSLILVVHGQGMMASPGPSDNLYSANDGLSEFKMKMAQIMGSANQEKENSAPVENQGAANGLNAAVPGVNSSDVNRSADNPSANHLSTVNPIPLKSAAPKAGAFNSSELNRSEFNRSEFNRSEFNRSEFNRSEFNRSEFNSSAEQPQLASPQNSSQNSSKNSYFVNQSLENRTSGVGPGNNSTSKTASNSSSGGSMLSERGSISPSGINFDNQATFNGDWSMRAGKQGFGSNGINDRMALSGDFNVHKTVSFKE
jgi:hypothetical protein